jgi:MFS family permease
VNVRYRMLAIMTLAQIGGAVVQQGFGSLAPSIVHFFHINKAQLGLAFTAIMAGSAITVALGGAAVDRFGERNVTIFAGSAICASLIVASIVPAYSWLVAWLFVMGLSYATVTPAGGRAILTWFHRDRGFAMSIRQMGVPVGGVLGGILMPLLAVRFDYQIALLGGGVLALILTSGSALFYRDPEGHEFPPTRFRHVLGGMRSIARDPRTIYYTSACALLAMVQQQMNGFLALTATTHAHATIALAATVFITAQSCSIFGRLFWGRSSDVLFGGDRVVPVALMCVLSALASIGLAFTSPGSLVLLFASGMLMGFAGAGWNGLFSAAMAEIGGARFAGSAIGVGLTAIFISGAVGPWLFGAFADAYGLEIAWLCVAVVAASGLIPALLAKRAFAAAELRERAAMG